MGENFNTVKNRVENTRGKFSADQIAKWFIEKSIKEVKNGGEYLTQMKLQKLLYYAKGFYYVFENEPLFNENCRAITYGPVVDSIVPKIKKYKSEPIKDTDAFDGVEPIKDKNIITFLNFIYDNLASVYAAPKLVELTHNEEPWQKTVKFNDIDENLISAYFRKTYFGDVTPDWVVPKNKLLSGMSLYNMKKYDKAYKVLAQC